MRLSNILERIWDNGLNREDWVLELEKMETTLSDCRNCEYGEVFCKGNRI